MKIYLDFESRSQADIFKTGAWVYSIHPSTEILCLCYAIDDGPVYTLTRSNIKDYIKLFEEYVKKGAEFHAHNAYFERSMWANKLVPLYGAPKIPINQWRCTAAKAYAHALPAKLERVAEALECKNRKDKVGNTLMKALATSKGPIEPEKLNRLYQYCIQDVLVEREIDQRLPDLSPREQQVWFMDQYINDTGVCIDVEAVKKADECIKQEVAELTDELKQLTGGEIDAGTQTAAIKKWLEKKGCKLPNLQKKTVIEAIKSTPGENLRVLQLRQQLSLTSNAKYSTLLDTVAPDGRVRDILVYHGASTGRWTGKLVQVHNLPKPKTQGFDNLVPLNLLKNSGVEAFRFLYDGDVLGTLSSCIRGVLIPSPGCSMFITDFAAIEARVVMWLAREENGLKMFQDQDADPTLPDAYVQMARVIYNRPSLTKKDKAERQLGKQATLGCGFGMGAKKFRETCANYDIIIDEVLADRAVNAYRSTFKKVVNFWDEMERKAILAVQTKQPQQVGYITWRMDHEFLRMVLPTGRSLSYHRPRVSAENRLSFMASDPKTKQYTPEDTWGGTLVENAVQAVARDIMVDSMFEAYKAGFSVLLTVHDELVTEAPKGVKTAEDMLRITKKVPSWAPGCPINAECEEVQRYKK